MYLFTTGNSQLLRDSGICCFRKALAVDVKSSTKYCGRGSSMMYIQIVSLWIIVYGS